MMHQFTRQELKLLSELQANPRCGTTTRKLRKKAEAYVAANNLASARALIVETLQYDRCAQELTLLAIVLCKSGEYEAAKKVFKEAETNAAILSQISWYHWRHWFIESKDLYLDNLLNQYGDACLEQGQTQEAERVFNRSLTINLKLNGPRGSAVAIALTKLAQAKYLKGDLKAARALYEKALPMLKSALTEYDSAVLNCIDNLIIVVYRQRDKQHWKPLLTEALHLHRKCSGRTFLSLSEDKNGRTIQKREKITGALSIETITQLLKIGSDINRKSGSGNTPLMSAVRRQDNELVKLLIAGGADVDATDQLGTTALMKGGRLGDCVIVATLLDAGAAVPLQNAGGFSASALARKFGHIELAEIIENYSRAGEQS